MSNGLNKRSFYFQIRDQRPTEEQDAPSHHDNTVPFERNRERKRRSVTAVPRREQFGCHLCEWKGYQTYAGRDYAEVRRCSCQEEVCTKCDGAGGYLFEMDNGYEAWKSCECTTFEKKMEMCLSARIPARFAAKTLDAFAPGDQTQQRSREHLYQLLINPQDHAPFQPGDKGVLLMGPTGVGKTHLMVGFLRHLILERGISSRFVDFGVLLSELRDCYNRGLSEMDILTPLINIDVLLLDDLGKGRNSKWELGIIDTLLSARYNAGRTTLITTNYTDNPETTLRERSRGRGGSEGEELLTRDTLYERVGDRIYSRLQEMCTFFYVRGSDYRRQRR
jgi:DNA replication protein DnaC